MDCVGCSGWLHLSVLQRGVQSCEQIFECVEHFLCNLSLAGVLVRPHLAQSLKILQLSTTDLYLFVVVVVVVGLGAALWKANRFSAFVENGQPLDSWWFGKPWVSSLKIDVKRGRRVWGGH